MSLAAGSAGNGTRWAVLQNAGKHGIDLLIFLCLARLVAPQDFGLVAMASAAVVLVTVLTEMGLGDALVQRRALDDHATTAFWFALAIGGAGAAILFFAAPLAGSVEGNPDLVPVLRALCPLFVIQALNIVPQALLQREMAFRPLALRTLSGSIAGGVAGFGLALADAGPWSLVAQQLVSALVGLAGLWWFSSWRPTLRFSKLAAAELFGFGRYVLGARMLNVLASKADAIVVGLVLGPLALGFYSVACRMLLALEQLFCQGVDMVALSAFSRVGDAKDAMRALFQTATRTAAVWAFPVFGGAMLMAPDLVHVSVGEAWMPSAPLLQVLLVAGLLQALTHFNHAVFKACGRPELSLRIAAASTALNVLTLAIGVQFGIQAVALSYALRTALIAPFGVVLACRLVALPLASYAAGLLRPALGLAAGAALVWVVAKLLPGVVGVDAGLIPRLLGQIAVGAAAYAVCVGPPNRRAREAAARADAARAGAARRAARAPRPS